MFEESSHASPDRTVASGRASTVEEKNEFERLRSLLPSISTENRVSQINVLEEAIKYIAHLQAALENHSAALTTEEVQRRFRESSCPGTVIRLNRRRVASFHTKLRSRPKPRRIQEPPKDTKQNPSNHDTTRPTD